MEMRDQMQAPVVAGSKVRPKTDLDFGKEKHLLPLRVIEARFFGQQLRILLVVLSTLFW